MWIQIIDSEMRVNSLVNAAYVVSVIPSSSGQFCRIIMEDRSDFVTYIPFDILMHQLTAERGKKTR